MIGEVINGVATVKIPRGTYSNGNYTVRATYLQTDEYKSATSTGTLIVFPFSFDSTDDYIWKRWNQTTQTNLISPSVTSDTVDGQTKDVIQMGRYNLVVLLSTIPVNEENTQIDVLLKSSTNDRIFLGSYAEVTSGTHAGDYTVQNRAFNVKIQDLNINDGNYHLFSFIFEDGICKLYVDETDVGLSYDFTNFQYDYNLMFYSYGTNTIKVADISYMVG